MQVALSPDLLLLDGWEAVPIAARLREVEEASDVERPWRPIRVPVHWQLEKGFEGYQGRVLYRCRFRCRKPGAGEMVSLRFGGVYYAARVWLNGNCLGGHEGYFAPFEFDCTDAVS